MSDSLSFLWIIPGFFFRNVTIVIGLKIHNRPNSQLSSETRTAMVAARDGKQVAKKHTEFLWKLLATLRAT